MNSLGYLVVFLFASLVAQVVIFHFASRVFRLELRTVGQSIRVVTVKLLFESLAFIAQKYFLANEDEILLGAGYLIIDLVFTLVLLALWFGGTVWRQMGVWALNLCANIVVGIGLIFVFRVFAATYIVSNSSMSPNLRGYHVVELLADGNHFIVTAEDPGEPRPKNIPIVGIVAETYESHQVELPTSPARPPDRFICNKLKEPRRWDAVVFRTPRGNSLVVKRLVALPGEKLEIRENAAWINGQRLSPPDHLGPIRYSVPDEGAASFEQTLGPDEYFVLGDNTAKSADSRMYGPISRESVLGVADLIYWPPLRWKIDP